MQKERVYRSDDRDIEGCDNELVVFAGENGDWYVAVRTTGERIGKAVRITTSGTPRGFERMPRAVARLYAALRGTATYDLVFQALNEFDPEGLLRMGAPTDEYASEAEEIADAIDAGRKPSAELVQQVWQDFFGRGTDAAGTAHEWPMPMRPVFKDIADWLVARLRGEF